MKKKKVVSIIVLIALTLLAVCSVIANGITLYKYLTSYTATLGGLTVSYKESEYSIPNVYNIIFYAIRSGAGLLVVALTISSIIFICKNIFQEKKRIVVILLISLLVLLFALNLTQFFSQIAHYKKLYEGDKLNFLLKEYFPSFITSLVYALINLLLVVLCSIYLYKTPIKEEIKKKEEKIKKLQMKIEKIQKAIDLAQDTNKSLEE